MADVEFQDFSIRVTEAMNEALIAALHEAIGDLHTRTVRNSRQGHTYGEIQATALWKTEVDEGKMEAHVGSEHEAAYWEEFGTGEYAIDQSKSRKGWWIYVEGKDDGDGGKTRSEAQAKAIAASMRSKGKPAHATNGMEPNRPLHRAFESGKSAVERTFAEKLKGL